MTVAQGTIDIEAVRRRSIFSAISTGFGAAVLFGSIIFAAVELHNAQARLDTTNGEVAAAQARRDGLNKEISSLQRTVVAMKVQIAQLRPAATAGLGYHDGTALSDAGLHRSLSAYVAANALGNGGGAARGATAIHVFSKDIEKAVNANVVLPRLRDLGFKVVEMPGTAPLRDVPTNTLWFGSAVAIGDVRLVALTLMAAGVDLKAIRPFGAATAARKAHQIDIGAWTGAVRGKSLTVEQVRAKAFAAP